MSSKPLLTRRTTAPDSPARTDPATVSAAELKKKQRTARTQVANVRRRAEWAALDAERVALGLPEDPAPAAVDSKALEHKQAAVRAEHAAAVLAVSRSPSCLPLAPLQMILLYRWGWSNLQ